MVAEFLARPGALTWVVPEHDADYPVFGLNDILDAEGPVPELEALQRWAMVLHNQYPWDRSRTELRPNTWGTLYLDSPPPTTSAIARTAQARIN